VTRATGVTTTAYAGGLWEADYRGGTRAATRGHYTLAGQVIARRDSSTNALTSPHGDHLGSVGIATDRGGAVANWQDFDPWGQVRAGGIGETPR